MNNEDYIKNACAIALMLSKISVKHWKGGDYTLSVAARNGAKHMVDRARLIKKHAQEGNI